MITTIAMTTALLVPQGDAQGNAGTRSVQPEIRLSIKRSAQVRGTDVLIGDLADIDPIGDESLRIGALVFGKPPSFGYPRTVSRREILQSLAAHGEDLERYRVSGDKCMIQSVHRTVELGELRHVADAVLRAALDTVPGEEIEFTLDNRVREFKVRPGRDSLEFTAEVREGSIGFADAVVDVTFLVDGEPDRKVALRYQLERFHWVVRTVRAVRAGERLDRGNIARARVKVSAGQGFHANELDQVLGKIARRPLQKGRPVSVHDTREPAVIREGQLVEVIARRGRIQVVLRALANHDAAKGEVLRLTNIDSRQSLTAVARAPGLAVIAH